MHRFFTMIFKESWKLIRFLSLVHGAPVVQSIPELSSSQIMVCSWNSPSIVKQVGWTAPAVQVKNVIADEESATRYRDEQVRDHEHQAVLHHTYSTLHRRSDEDLVAAHRIAYADHTMIQGPKISCAELSSSQHWWTRAAFVPGTLFFFLAMRSLVMTELLGWVYQDTTAHPTCRLFCSHQPCLFVCVLRSCMYMYACMCASGSLGNQVIG